LKKLLFAAAVLTLPWSISPVFADDEAAFVAACLSSSNMNQSLCECTAQKAKQELSPKGFDFLVATLRRDDQATAKLRTEMTVQEMTQAGMFMTRGPAQCAQES